MFAQEEKRILDIIKSRFNKGEEFKANIIFDLISKNYLEWFMDHAKKNRVYCRNYNESATLEILESLQSEGILKKRIEI